MNETAYVIARQSDRNDVSESVLKGSAFSFQLGHQFCVNVACQPGDGRLWILVRHVELYTLTYMIQTGLTSRNFNANS